jgi:hypothetical protein
MDHRKVLLGQGEDLTIYAPIVRALENLEEFPFLIEDIYREAMQYGEDDLDRLRFGLIRLQVYAEIHRYENAEETHKMQYVAQVLEKVLFGGLLLEGKESGDACCPG